MKPTLKTLFVALSLGLSAVAHADPADYLKSQLEANPAAGKFIKEFPAVDTLTGVVIQVPNGQKMVGYLTPSGRYLISGVVIDLEKNNNLTQQYAAQYGGKPPEQPAVYDAQAVYELGKTSRISLGNENSPNYIAVMFDPTTEIGRKLMFLMMNQVSRFVNTAIFEQAHFDFIPYGKAAPALLKGSNKERLKNLLEYAQGKPLPAPDKAALDWAKRNDDVAKSLKAKPPLMVVNVPGQKEAKAVSFVGAKNDPDSALALFLGMVGQGAGEAAK